MKRKNLTYFLILFIVAIWGYIGYGIIAGLKDPEETTSLRTNRQNIATVSTTSDTFRLLTNYPDPFLRKSINIQTNNSSGKNNFSKKVIKQKEPEVKIDWNFISYLGIIKNNNKKVNLIVIHGKEHMMSEGDQVGEVKLIKGFKDSIEVTYQGKKSYIKRL